MGLMWV